MSRWFRYFSPLLILPAIGLLTGCGSSSSPTQTASSGPVAGGTAVIAMPPDLSPDGFFPVNSTVTYSDINSQVQALMYKPLLDITAKDNINYDRSLAAKIQWNASGTVYTITLSHKYRWSNGNPVTAQDVVFAWSLMKAASAANAPWTFGGAGFGGIPTRWESVVATNPDTVTVTLNAPSNQQWFIRNGLGQLTPVPKSVWDKYPNNMTQELKFVNQLQNNPAAPEYRIVDGPYHFASMAADRYWSFTPNSAYGGHKSYLSKVIFQYETSDASEFTGLKTGIVNLGYLPFSLWDSKSELTADKVSHDFLFGFNYMNINMDPTAGFIPHEFSHLYVRQALQMGIDQPGIVQSFYHSAAVSEFGPLPSKPTTVFDDPALKNPYPFNPKAGLKLLEAHGWTMDKGVLQKDGHPFDFTILYAEGSTSAADSLQVITHDWQEEGIDASLEPQPANTAFSVMLGSNQSKWQMTYFPGGWTYEPDYYPTGGGLFSASAGGNYSHYRSNTMNHLVKLTYKPVASQAAALASLAHYQAWAVHDLPVLWMPYFPSLVVNADTLHGVVKAENPVTDLYYPNYWWESKS